MTKYKDKNVVITSITDFVTFEKVMSKIDVKFEDDLQETFDIIKGKSKNKSGLKFAVVVRPDDTVYFSLEAYYKNFNKETFVNIHFTEVLGLGLDEAIEESEKEDDNENENESENDTDANKSEDGNETLTTDPNNNEKSDEENTPSDDTLVANDNSETILPPENKDDPEERAKLMEEFKTSGAMVDGMDYSAIDNEGLKKIIATTKV